MTGDIVMEFNAARRCWDEFAELTIDNQLLYEVNFPVPVFSQAELAQQTGQLNQTQFTRPALGISSLAYLALFKQLRINADFYAGHSYGELVALYAAGIIQSKQDLLYLSQQRGRLMAQAAANTSGGMSAVLTGETNLRECLLGLGNKIMLANINTPTQIVISAATDDLIRAEALLAEADISYQRLPVSTAFHSTIVKSCVPEFKAILDNIKLSTAKQPVYANSNAKKYPRQSAQIKKRLAEQIAQPVNFAAQISRMYKEDATVFVEAGPGNVLTKLIGQIVPDAQVVQCADKQTHGLVSWWQALGKLSILGTKIDFAALWDEFTAPEDSVDKSQYSKAVVFINGSNYNKPYPPKDDQLKFVSHTKAMDLAQTSSATPASAAGTTPINSISQGKPKSISQATSTRQQVTPTQTNNIDYKQQGENMSDNDPIEHDHNWYQALNSLQQNMLDAQKTFQDSLLQSHAQFMQVTNNAIAQLSGDRPSPVSLAAISHNIDVVQTPNRPVDNSTAIADAFVPSEANNSMPVPAPMNNKPVTVNNPVAEQAMPLPPTIKFDHSLQAQTPVAAAPESKADNEATTDDGTIDLEEFKAALLAIVAEKTGYPKEMLELDADLAAELGIDSIKNVEILSALQNQYTQLKQVETSRLVELNSLGKIIDFAASEINSAGQIVGVNTDSTVTDAAQETSKKKA